MDISDNLFPVLGTIKDAMNALNQGINGVLLCVNKDGKMKGLITDGDIRRGLLLNQDISIGVSSIMNKNFVYGSTKNSDQENLSLLNAIHKHIPILNESGVPENIISWSDIWNLPVSTPSLAGNELKYVTDCIKTNWISSQGDYVRKFEEAFSNYFDNTLSVSVSSGTAALHLALLSLGIGKGDEVLVPNITFGASANVVVNVGATPVFVDIESNFFTMETNNLQKYLTKKTKAIMPVHIYGHPCDMEPILEFASKNNLWVIEDCAEALGAEYKGTKVGKLGDIGCFSFFANKIITTGEGGMVITKHPALINKIKLYRDHGMKPDRRYWHEVPGLNYRLTNVQAAIGLAQLEQLEKFLNHRMQIVDCYNYNLKNNEFFTIPKSAKWAKNIFWLYTIVLREAENFITRDELATALKEKGVDTRNVFEPLHLQPAYSSPKENFENSLNFASNGLCLPMSNSIKINDVQKVCEILLNILPKVKVR
jgi:perosamine synthetase